MDLLYSRYASPYELMGLYIRQGRFGEFVSEIIEMNRVRERQTIEKENDDRLWSIYIRSFSDKTFDEWKKTLKQEKESVSYAMTDKQIENVKEQAKGILKKITPV